MKKLAIGLSCVLAVMALTVPAMAKGPVGEAVTINWCEDGIRKNGDGSDHSDWQNEPCGPATLVQTGKAYHFADIGDFYYYVPEGLSGKLVISGSGKLSGHATYTSTASGLPIKERFKGQVNVDTVNGTWTGTCTQWSYAFGTFDEVSAHYTPKTPAAEKQGKGWWLVYVTEYDFYAC